MSKKTNKNNKIGEKTMIIGKRCKRAGIVGFCLLINLIPAIIFQTAGTINADETLLILGYVFDVLFGIAAALSVLYFVGVHYICIGKNEINTRNSAILLEQYLQNNDKNQDTNVLMTKE